MLLGILGNFVSSHDYRVSSLFLFPTLCLSEAGRDSLFQIIFKLQHQKTILKMKTIDTCITESLCYTPETNTTIMSDSLWPHGLYSPWSSSSQSTGVGSHSLLLGIFSTQGLNPGLSHCRQILYQLGHKGSPRILEWVAYPFSSGSSQPRNWTRVSCIVGGFFANWVIRETP